MARFFLALFFSPLFLIAPCLGAGFGGPGVLAPVTCARDVLTAYDDTPCVLEGRIIEKLPHRKNRYVFEDASGRIIVKIKRHIFGDFTVTPDLLVRITGEVDDDDKYANEVEVDYLGIIGPAKIFGKDS